jgi:DNA polymerase-3 subunit delta
MQVPAERLLERLGKGTLEANYFFYGEEPLQLSECSDALRRRALDDGILERLVFDIDGTSDWGAILAESSAMSLFAERRLIEIRLGSRKADKTASAALEQLATRPPDDDIVLISAAKLDASSRKAKWFKALESNSVSVATRDLKAQQLPAWLNRRAARYQKRLSSDAARLITERVEGNLLAAAQEVEKLCLLVDTDDIEACDVINAVTDSARFDVYQFVDAVLACDLPRALRVVHGLRDAGTEPILVVWALGRELRQLAAMAGVCATGVSINATMVQYHVWSSRQGLIGAALARFSEQDLLALLTYANFIDTVIKGGRVGAPWDDIEILVLRLCETPGAAAMTPAY